MCFSRTVRCGLSLGLLWALSASCGGSDGKGATSGAGTKTQDAQLQLVVDFDRKRFELVQGGVALWSLPFHNPDSSDVPSWIESFGRPPGEVSAPLAENILLRSRNLLKDSVLAIVAGASGFDAHLLQRRIPARFVLRWEDAALEVISPVSGSSGGFGEYWQGARSTARRLFGEEQMTVHVDSIGALTLQRAAVPPISTRIKPPKKR